jgi:hypothetical protein
MGLSDRDLIGRFFASIKIPAILKTYPPTARH